MSRKYLILPRVEYRGANAMPAWWCTGAPGPMAARGFAGALAIAIGGRGAIGWLRGASVVHHDVSLRAERIGRRLYPHQLRAASLVSKDDYAGSSGTALSSQPTVRCDGVASLVCAFAVDAPIDAGAVENFLRRARFAGGTVADHGFEASRPLIAGNLREAAACVRSGFSFHDRADLLVPKQGEADPLDAFLRATRREKRPQEQIAVRTATEQLAAESTAEVPEAWLQPYLAGYRALTALDPAARSRDGHPHAFAEPLVGLAQLVSLRSKGLSLWDYSNVHGLYAVSQTH
jgi:CRISPR type I-F-associated protein Csy2